MFRFADPNFLYLLIILPFVVALYLYSNYRRRQNIRKYGDPTLLKHLMPTISKYRPDIKFWLIFAALTLVILMLARPQFGSKMETVKRSGVEAVIALDISNSMLAEDVTPSRLDKAKKLISRLVDTFNNDKVGLIVFAGDAFTQLPITSDYVSAKMFLETINPSLITTQGTDIGAAIRLAMKSFTPQEGVGRAIIVITDGENHEGGAVEAAKEAAEKGMQVFVLGIGSPDGSPIPSERGSNDYRRDKDGNVIVTRLNEQMCQEIAKAGNGLYIRVDNSNSAEKILNNEIAKLSKADVEDALELVGLTEFGDRLAKQYSLGMKQRLGLAGALLGRPPILILDDPTNGLDPSGIHEIRNLVKSLPSLYDCTVLISSHMLSEIELIADDIGILNHGRLLFEGSMNDLRQYALQSGFAADNLEDVFLSMVEKDNMDRKQRAKL